MAVTCLARINNYRTGTRILWLYQRHTANFTGSATEDLEAEYNQRDVRNMILAASLPFVSQYGWSRAALSAGATSVGYPGITHGLFPGGGADLVHHFNLSCNSQLSEKLKQNQQQVSEEQTSKFVEEAVTDRLRMVLPYLDRWSQALAIMSLPPNIPNSLATLLNLVDDICYYAGDKSVDFSWYTHRITLAGIYKATELHLLQDRSENHQATWNFLKRSIEDSIRVQHYLHQSKDASQFAKETITAAFVTARNILGLNRSSI